VRRHGTKGKTGRYSKLDANAKREIDLTQVLGGVKEWRKEEFGIVIQEGRFNQDEYEPRDKREIKTKLAKIERQKRREEKMAAGEDPDDSDEEEEEEEDPNSKAAIKRRQRQQRLKMLVKREGRILSSKDFPHDPVDYHEYDTFVQVAMETSDAAELIAEKVRAKFHKVNFNFKVAHFEAQPRPNQHAVTDFDREKPY